jgi:hypothetical protein
MKIFHKTFLTDSYPHGSSYSGDYDKLYENAYDYTTSRKFEMELENDRRVQAAAENVAVRWIENVDQRLDGLAEGVEEVGQIAAAGSLVAIGG